jgi:hypothetical protein
VADQSNDGFSAPRTCSAIISSSSVMTLIVKIDGGLTQPLTLSQCACSGRIPCCQLFRNPRRCCSARSSCVRLIHSEYFVSPQVVAESVTDFSSASARQQFLKSFHPAMVAVKQHSCPSGGLFGNRPRCERVSELALLWPGMLRILRGAPGTLEPYNPWNPAFGTFGTLGTYGTGSVVPAGVHGPHLSTRFAAR